MRARIDAIGVTVPGPTAGQLLRRRIFGHQGMLLGAGALILIVVMAVFAPLLTSSDPYHQDLVNRLIPPIWQAKGTWAHPLGTDYLGRDYLSRLMYGGRISLLIRSEEHTSELQSH